MDQTQHEKETNGRQRVIQSILEAGSKAFDPKKPESSRAQAVRDFDDVIQRAKTVHLIPALNLLLKPGAAPPWLRTKVMEELTRVPLRPDGVRATLEFLFSVHPSSTVKVSEAAVPQKQGANITLESLKLASNLVCAIPASVTPETWYSAIAPQLLALLDGGEGPELAKAASYIVGFGILAKRSSGAPGTAGWKFFAEPILGCIRLSPNAVVSEPDGITDLSREKILVQPNDISTALHRLHSLLTSHPNSNVCQRLVGKIPDALWALASWPSGQPSISEELSTPALELLKIFVKLTPNRPDFILYLVKNVGYLGGYDKSNPEWVYSATEEGQVQIVDTRQPMGKMAGSAPRITFEDIEEKISKLVDFISSTLSDSDVSATFLELFKRWLKSARGITGGDIITEQKSEQDPVTQLTEIKVLQAMMERLPEKLATEPKHTLDLASQILSSSGDDQDSNDEVIEVALSLLNMVITAPGFQKSHVEPTVLALIESSLDKLSKCAASFSQTATNLRLLLLYRDELDDTPATTAPTARQIEDRKTYNLAISYITEANSPPPVRSEGLNLLSSLITAQSPILDIPGMLVLLSSLLSDPDSFIYLRVIRLYTLLAAHHPSSVVRELTDHLADPNETHPVDTRLRFGEALMQVIQRLGETFTGPLAAETGHALLSVAGRRAPRRAKTEARQAREARSQEKRDREAADAWGGQVPDMSDPLTPQQKATNAVLEAIVEGWESKRGAEDVRVRTSALAVLGAAVEVNVAGLGREVVVAAVEVCVAVLQLEREMEKGILRRAAVVFVLSFVRALEAARERGRELGFGFGRLAQEDVMRTLRYVAETDNDGLVVQHARDVVESLEDWQAIKLLPVEGGDIDQALGGLTKLAGLAVDPERALAGEGSSKPRPRIEEIE